jgi:molybdopterin-biosynthesis enzyme MoeA-like protein
VPRPPPLFFSDPLQPSVRAEIVLVGDELLEDLHGVQPDYMGDLVEHLVTGMTSLGLAFGRLVVTGDTPGELAPLLMDTAVRGVDLVVTIGGLGPTHDDRVRDDVAQAVGLGPSGPHPEAMGWLIDAYESRSIPVPERGGGWERMGHCPPGARPLRNPVGLACGLAFELGDSTRVRCLPGVTYEALPMWQEQVLPELEAQLDTEGVAGDPIGKAGSSATLLVKGVREGVVAPVVEEFTARWPDLRTGVYLMDLVDGSFRTIRVTVRGSEDMVENAIVDLRMALENIEGARVHLRKEGPDND